MINCLYCLHPLVVKLRSSTKGCSEASVPCFKCGCVLRVEVITLREPQKDVNSPEFKKNEPKAATTFCSACERHMNVSEYESHKCSGRPINEPGSQTGHSIEQVKEKSTVS